MEDALAYDRARLPYPPGLDGPRTLAVVAVLLYQAEPGPSPGGFLGVEVFFVIGGYLITALLPAGRREWGASTSRPSGSGGR